MAGLPGVNGQVVTATVVLVGGGVLTAYKDGKPAYQLVIGGLLFMVVLGLLDSFGGPASDIASGLAMLAMVYTILHVFPWDVFGKLLKS